MSIRKESVFVDSINGDICRLLIGKNSCPVEIPLLSLPEGTSEGDWLLMVFEKCPDMKENASYTIKKLLSNAGDKN